MSLNLFPVRVPIGTATDKNGTNMPVLMTPEFARALSDLFELLGSGNGISLMDLEQLGTDALIPKPDAAIPDQMTALQPDYAGEVAQLRQQVADLAMMVQAMAPTGGDTSMQDMFMVLSTTPVNSVDWERPGSIGRQTPNRGAFTTLTASAQFGCNGKSAQASVALGAAATDLPTVIALANNIRTALINNGIGS